MSKLRHIALGVPAMLASAQAWAQEAAPAAAAQPATQLVKGIANIDLLLGALIAAVIILFLAVIGIGLALYYLISNSLMQPEQAAAKAEAKKVEAAEEGGSGWAWFWKQFNAAKPIKEEHSILLNHDYDGIRELDNDLPPWWKYLFYACIAFAVVYLGIYHWSNDSKDAVSVAEYKAEVKDAAEAKKAYLAQMANSIDETNVEATADAAALEDGKTVFMANCKACHGGAGEGGVGPNLTDVYWLHGGDVKDLFKTVKYGVPDKGMVPWESKLTPLQIQNVTSYILTLKGTNPANAKAPQGQEYVPAK